MIGSASWFAGIWLYFITSTLAYSFSGRNECTHVMVQRLEGEIHSANFPQQYPANACTVWDFSLRPTNVVTISMVYLDLPRYKHSHACSSNYLEFSSQTEHRVVCGTQAATYTSPTDLQQFSIKFFSGSPEGRGFKLSYSVGPIYSDDCFEDQFRCNDGKCIPEAWLCNGRIECPDNSDEASCNGQTDKPATTLRPQQPPSSTPHPLKQDSGQGQGDDEGKGQSAVAKVAECSPTLYNRSGHLHLHIPSGTPRTDGFASCQWTIRAPRGVKRIVLRVDRSQLQPDGYVLVYQVTKGSRPRVSSLLGLLSDGSVGRTVVGSSGVMVVKFLVAPSRRTTAVKDLIFDAEYIAYGDTDSGPVSTPHPALPLVDPDECQHHLVGQTGNFTMPTDPFHPGDVRDCAWLISRPHHGYSIHLLFTFLHLQGGASVQVFDGAGEQAPSLGVFNQKDHLVLPVSVRSTGSSMLVRFFAPTQSTPSPSHPFSFAGSHQIVFEANYHFEDMCELAFETHCGQGDNRCYTLAERCDGIWDCPVSGADEVGCYGCPENSYSCNSFGPKHKKANKCYFKHDRCNGGSVCENYSDENNCSEDMCRESRNLFLCANKRCILYDFLCDNVNDCGDGSDEQNCDQGSSRKVIVAAVVGSLLCALLLVLSLGCACKLYNLRHGHHHHHRGSSRHPHQHSHRGHHRYDTPLSRLQAEMFRRRAPPPPYHEAMLTSWPYDQAVREYLAQAQAETAEPSQAQSAEQENSASDGAAATGSGEGASTSDEATSADTAAAENEDPSVQNLISLMDISEEGGSGEHREHRQLLGHSSARLEIHLSNASSSSESESDGEGEGCDLAGVAESGHFEMQEAHGRWGVVSGSELRSTERELGLVGNVSEDSASASLSADSHEMVSLGDDAPKDSEEGGEGQRECPSPQPPPTSTTADDDDDSDKEEGSDADSVCILCLEDQDPAAEDDGSDTRCLLQDV